MSKCNFNKNLFAWLVFIQLGLVQEAGVDQLVEEELEILNFRLLMEVRYQI